MVDNTKILPVLQDYRQQHARGPNRDKVLAMSVLRLMSLYEAVLRADGEGNAEMAPEIRINQLLGLIAEGELDPEMTDEQIIATVTSASDLNEWESSRHPVRKMGGMGKR